MAWYDAGQPLPHPVLAQARDQLSRDHHEDAAGPLVTAGLCLYRDGRDSVAWHGDTIGRGATQDTVVAIVSLGAARPLLLRPRAVAGHCASSSAMATCWSWGLLPADLGPCRPQDQPVPWPPGVRAVPARRGALTRPRAPAAAATSCPDGCRTRVVLSLA